MADKYLVLIRGGDWIPDTTDAAGGAIMSKARALAALCPTSGTIEFRPVFEFSG